MDTQNFQDTGEIPTQNTSHDFQTAEFARSSLLSPVAPIETATAFQHFPALRNITTRELFYFFPDDSLCSLQDLGVFFPERKGAELFLDTFRLAHPEYNYTHTSVVKTARAVKS